MKRKSPIKHHVRSHTRSGNPVHDYDRGHGEHPPKLSNPHIKSGNKQEIKNYQVIIKYTNLPTESFPVKSKNYPQAIELGLLSRLHITPPYKLDVRKFD